MKTSTLILPVVLAVFAIPTLCHAGGPADFVVNEVLADPQGDANGDGAIDTADRFIELVNTSSQAVDISGWTLKVAATLIHTFSVNTIVDPGYPVVVFEGALPIGLDDCAIFQTASSGSVTIDPSNGNIGLSDGSANHVTAGILGLENGQSINRNPDLDAQSAFHLHSQVSGANGDLFSPGTRTNGFPFVSDCIATVTCDMDQDGILGLGDSLFIMQSLAGLRVEPGAYRWEATQWSGCSQTCGDGVTTRTVVCKDWLDATVDDGLCSGDKPASAQACNTHSCTTSWNVGEWSDCSVACGGGTASRPVVCMDPTGATVDDGQCTGTKPATTQPCNTHACAYAWSIGPWSDCSVDCGTGTATREVVCQDEAGNTVDDAFCGVKPATSQACNTDPCSYAWHLGEWSDCSVDCGGGSQNRTVTCRDHAGNVVADGNCTDAQPASSQVCNTDPCAYSWIVSAWGDCSADCGGGIQYRTVTCQDQVGNVVDNINCTGPAPSNTQACNTTPCP